MKNKKLNPTNNYENITEFLEEIEKFDIAYSISGEERLKRSHGQTLHEIFTLRINKLPERLPDVIAWPSE